MISLLLLLLTLILSAIIVRIGAIALELTGLPMEQASFQALTSLSGVGYTTKEAEFVLSHPQRRRIIKTLIVLGSAGVVTTVATLGGAVLSSHSIMSSMMSQPIAPWFPLNEAQVVLLLIVGMLFLLFKAFYTPALSRLTKEIISAGLLKGQLVHPVGLHEMLVTGGGFGVFQFEVTPTHPLVDVTIKEAGLSEAEITVLSVNRLSASLEHPTTDFRIHIGDVLTVFGPIAAIRDRCTDQAAAERELTGEELRDAPLSLMAEAPDFALPDQRGRVVKLAEYRGARNVLLVFYPKDRSFFCSRQLADYRDHLNTIHGLRAEVVAINPESEASHAGFCDASHLSFPLLSDRKKTTCRAYRTLIIGGLLIDRTVYIIDRQGRIRYAARGRPPMTELLSTLRRLSQEGEKGTA